MPQRRLAIAAFLFLLLAACAAGPSNGLQHTHYAQTGAVFLAETLPPPPVPGSAEEREDLAAVLRAQAIRTAAQVQAARADAALSVFRFQDTLSQAFTPGNLPVTAAFFRRLQEDEDRAIQLAKSHFNRPRPFVQSALVKPVVPQPPNASYPSGHACFGTISAIFLARMLPEKSAAIIDRGALYARNRIIAGAHYPTDVQAGRLSAAVIADALSRDRRFLADFAAAKRELRTALGFGE